MMRGGGDAGLIWVLVHIAYILVQAGESTQGITGSFEVTVNGKLVHSKKVSSSISVYIMKLIWYTLTLLRYQHTSRCGCKKVVYVY